MSKAIIFDLDGTLVDSVVDLHAALNKTLNEEGLGEISEADTRRFVGNGAARLVTRALDHLDVAKDPKTVTHTFMLNYLGTRQPATAPYPGVIELLDRLQGHPLAICTNKPLAATRKVLRATGITHFSAIVGGDSLPVLKPNPKPLLLALQMLQVDRASAVFIGDSEVDEATAKAANLQFALHSGGYRKKPVEEFDADFVFDRFADLGDWLTSTP